MPVSADHQDFAKRLIRWHRQHGRHNLPWQGLPADPYRVWLSEIMLQQTQVATVIPYFHRFMARFPTITQLAAAHEQEVLALWSGLGYYQRARNLLACARQIVGKHAGVFPSTAAALMSLPGIGASTAAAIAATVYQERAAILDGNVKRVLARVTRAEAPWGSTALERGLAVQAQARLPLQARQMPDYTQAIMDLGAMICRPKQPQCERCPVSMHCVSKKEGVVGRYPLPKAKRVQPMRTAYWALCCDEATVWLIQQPSRGIWPGLWLPWAIDPQALPADWAKTASHITEILEMRHSFTHYRLTISIAVLRWQGKKRPSAAPTTLRRFSWPDALALPLPAPVCRLLLRLCPSGIRSGDAPSTRSQT